MVICFILLFVTFVCNLLLGSASIDISELLGSDIFWQLRLARTLTAMCAGAVLALSGHLTQILFRNPLATPYTLGVASAAGLGAILSMSLGFAWSMVGISALGMSSLGIILLSLAYSSLRFNSNSILLLGIAINLFCTSAISIIQVTSGKLDLSMYLGWVMGSVSVVGYDALIYMLLPTIALVIVSFFQQRNLAILTIEGDDAYTRGFNPKKLRFLILGLITIAVATLVSKLGPIGFIGLVVPHFSKRFFKSQERTQIIGNIVLGALFLTLADLLNRTIFDGFGLPVGVMTTIFGAPTLGYIVWKKG